jgi:hypothetical protein
MLKRATITNCVTGDEVPVLFNPEDYTLAKDVNYAQAAVPGRRSPILQFVHGNLQTLDMELLLDTYESGGDVRELTGRIAALMDIQPATHAPPVLLFAWGSLVFRCVLARVSQRFIMFQPDGVPVRARLEVTFDEYDPVDLEAQEIKRETADHASVHVAGEGETLSSIAAGAYGDPALWRPIAIRNGLDDPRALAAGDRLELPPLPFTDPETGRVHSTR